jgi:hypothetical protein
MEKYNIELANQVYISLNMILLLPLVLLVDFLMS